MDSFLRQYSLQTGQVVALVEEDITSQQVDAIVNAANSRLEHGAGVAGAILARGGSEIQAESNAWVREHGMVSHDQPAVTGAGRLPCKYVIHAVGPVWGEGDEEASLGAAVRGSLQRAESLHLKSIALPAISTGVFGFPKERAARVILESIQGYFADSKGGSLETIRIVLNDRPTVNAFILVWAEIFLPVE